MRHRAGAGEQATRLALTFAGAFALFACTAKLTGDSSSDASTGSPGTGGGSNGSGSGSGGGVNAGPLPDFEPHTGLLRRLTRAQFRNAVLDLLGVEVNAGELEADSYDGDFSVIGATTVVTSDVGVERYHSTLEAAVDAVFADAERRETLVGCTPTAAQDPCLQSFVERLGRRAWRRPLTTDEVARVMGVVETATTELESPVEGARWATVALLTSPHFLYRPELGEPASTGTALRLSGYEMASRLAFLLWNTLPDEALLLAAEQGALSTPEGVLAAVDRLLSVPAGREAAKAFAEDYMRLDRIATQPKDPELFPEYGPALREGMVRDVREIWATIAIDDDASLLDVFSTNKVLANGNLARLYGLDDTGLDESTFKLFELPADSPRAGVLSKPGFLSQFANQKEGSPTLRGKFIREAIMCGHVPAPPGAVALELPETLDTPSTKRERLELHSTNKTCATCHAYMDPLGLPLETFDAIGRYRTTEQGLTIDSSGEFDGVPVADAHELGTVMSSSETVATCLARKYYSYAVGHKVRKVDEVVVQSLAEAFEASGYRFGALIRDIVVTDAFWTVTAPETE